MKKILFTLACASLLCACKGYLTVQPQGKVIPETDEEFAAIIHNHVNNIEGGEDQFIVGNFDGLILYESFSDNLDANVRIGAIAAYAGDKINTRQLYYKNYFSIIRDCNIVIENMSGRSSELSAKLLSASYAIKGICYYNLIRDYCDPYDGDRAELQPGLPLIDKFDMEEMPPRKALSATVAYTEELLKKSISYHTTDKMFLFTENIVKAYLAKLYFWVGDYDAVIPLCEELMQVKEYKLAGIDQYEKMIQAKNAQGQEVIVRSHINNNNDLDWYYSMIIKDLKTRPVNATLVHLFDEDKEADVRYAVVRQEENQPEEHQRQSARLRARADARGKLCPPRGRRQGAGAAELPEAQPHQRCGRLHDGDPPGTGPECSDKSRRPGAPAHKNNVRHIQREEKRTIFGGRPVVRAQKKRPPADVGHQQRTQIHDRKVSLHGPYLQRRRGSE